MLDDREIKALLLRIAARGDDAADAFERLYRLSAPLLLGVAKRVVARGELAEEVLHDTFARIWQAAHRFDPLATHPVAWMVAIARNRAIDTRSVHDVSHVESYHAGPEDDPDGKLDRLFDWSDEAAEREDARRAARHLRDCIGHLKAVERQALVLAYDRGMSHGELAAHFSRPLGTVKAWMRRAMAHLRECVEERLGATP